MERVLTVTFDDNEPDYPAIAVFEQKGRQVQMLSAYTGETAKELYYYLTVQGAFPRMMDRKKESIQNAI